MKQIKFIPAVLLLLSAVAFTSCRKNYNCTCTTVIGSVSTSQVHSIDKAGYVDARRECASYEEEGNASLPGTTTCRL